MSATRSNYAKARMKAGQIAVQAWPSLKSFLSRPDLFSGFLTRPDPERVDLVVLGSSSSEAFDYAIGPDPRYHPFWAGAWSARFLLRNDMQAYVRHILNPMPRNSHVLLNFGVADVIFNARYKAVKAGFYRFEAMVEEAVHAILMTHATVRSMGFRSVYPVFIAPVIELGEDYWQQTGPGRQLPMRLLGNMYHGIFEGVSARVECLDTFDALSQGGEGAWLLKKEFARITPDHHPDYIKMHDVIRDLLNALPGAPKGREEPLKEHYAFENTFVTELITRKATRQSTCR